MKYKLKRALTVVLCVALAVYVLLAMTSFNNPKDTYPLCTKVVINIEDESTNGFLSAAEIKRILEKTGCIRLRSAWRMSIRVTSRTS